MARFSSNQDDQAASLNTLATFGNASDARFIRRVILPRNNRPALLHTCVVMPARPRLLSVSRRKQQIPLIQQPPLPPGPTLPRLRPPSLPRPSLIAVPLRLPAARRQSHLARHSRYQQLPPMRPYLAQVRLPMPLSLMRSKSSLTWSPNRPSSLGKAQQPPTLPDCQAVKERKSRIGGHRASLNASSFRSRTTTKGSRSSTSRVSIRPTPSRRECSPSFISSTQITRASNSSALRSANPKLPVQWSTMTLCSSCVFRWETIAALSSSWCSRPHLHLIRLSVQCLRLPLQAVTRGRLTKPAGRPLAVWPQANIFEPGASRLRVPLAMPWSIPRCWAQMEVTMVRTATPAAV